MSIERKKEIELIEKRIVELKYFERDTERERDIIRYEMLQKAERAPVVMELVEKLFIDKLNVDITRLRFVSEPSGFTGRDGEEFLSEIKVNVHYVTDTEKSYSEIALVIYLKEGFEISEVRQKEKELMDKIISIRREVDTLREKKRNLRSAL